MVVADMNVTFIMPEITFTLHRTWQIAAFKSIANAETSRCWVYKRWWFLYFVFFCSSHYLWGWTKFRSPSYGNNSFFTGCYVRNSNKEYCKCKAFPLNSAKWIRRRGKKRKKKIYSVACFINKTKKKKRACKNK